MTVDSGESLVTKTQEVKIVTVTKVSDSEDRPIVVNKYRAHSLRWIVLALFVLYSGNLGSTFNF